MAHIDITNQEEFKSKVLDSTVPVVVDFWAEWCGPCKMVAPVFEELSGEYQDRLVFAKLDVDALPNIAAQYGVQSIPTMIVFKGGNEASRMIGAHPKPDYVREFNGLV